MKEKYLLLLLFDNNENRLTLMKYKCQEKINFYVSFDGSFMLMRKKL